MKTKFVLVETVSQYRMRYLVEVPKNSELIALDVVTQDKAKEFSQKHIGESILSHRVIDRKKAVSLYRQDHSYLHNWTDEQCFDNGLTRIQDYDQD